MPIRFWHHPIVHDPNLVKSKVHIKFVKIPGLNLRPATFALTKEISGDREYKHQTVTFSQL